MEQNVIRKILESEYDFSHYRITDSMFRIFAIRQGMQCYNLDREGAKYRGEDFKARVFGGKGNFIRYMEGLINKSEWKEHRARGLISEGDSHKKGNRKFDFLSDRIVFKPKRGVKIDLPLPQLRGKYKEIYQAILLAIEENQCPAVMVKLTNGEVQLTVDRNKLKPFLHKIRKSKPIKGRYLGIDLNPNYIGVSYFDEHQKLLDTRLYNFKSLTGKEINHNKLRNEVIEVFHEIGRIANHYRIQWYFMEDLSGMRGEDRKKGRGLNRLCNNQFLRELPQRILRNYGNVKLVNAAFTSTVGNVLHGGEFPDPIAASMEIARRGN